MFKIKNNTMSSQTVGISTETVHFNEEGIGEIESESIYNSVIQLPNFFPIQVSEEKEESDQEEPLKEAIEPLKEAIEPLKEAVVVKEEVKKAPIKKAPSKK